jgi:hypothetical protein
MNKRITAPTSTSSQRAIHKILKALTTFMQGLPGKPECTDIAHKCHKQVRSAGQQFLLTPLLANRHWMSFFDPSPSICQVILFFTQHSPFLAFLGVSNRRSYYRRYSLSTDAFRSRAPIRKWVIFGIFVFRRPLTSPDRLLIDFESLPFHVVHEGYSV